MAKLPRFRLPQAARMAEASTVIQRVLGGFLPASPKQVPHGAGFNSGAFANAAGTRPYRLYVPASYSGKPVPLVVMLHGCTQSPDDFATGTGMNMAADADNLLVLYPAQIAAANSSKCWNWFNPRDQQRGQGEPALIAGMVRMVMTEYAVDPRRVFVAGLSAGGAAAAIMAHAYPDVFAAACIHSGLACGAATDLISAMNVMRQGRIQAVQPGHAAQGRRVPVILFQGDHDSTVHPGNLDGLLEQFGAAQLTPRIETGKAPDGHGFTRTLYRNEDGIAMIEQWLIAGGGHAWSGGHAGGSFTDTRGPDATREMLRFFHAHPKQEG